MAIDRLERFHAHSEEAGCLPFRHAPLHEPSRTSMPQGVRRYANEACTPAGGCEVPVVIDDEADLGTPQPSASQWSDDPWRDRDASASLIRATRPGRVEINPDSAQVNLRPAQRRATARGPRVC
jgi:hypothetical protein